MSARGNRSIVLHAALGLNEQLHLGLESLGDVAGMLKTGQLTNQTECSVSRNNWLS